MKVQLSSENAAYADQLVKEMQLRNYSPRTIKTYSNLLSKLAEYFNIPLDKISTQQVKDFLHFRLYHDKISISTINQTISLFKILQVDIFGRDWEQIRIKRPRREKKLPAILSVDEVERLINAPNNIKHRAILALAYSAGLRRQEVQLIQPSHIDSQRMQVIVVQGKGKKDRFSLLSPKVLELLRTYYKLEHPKKYLFEPNGNKGVPLSENTFVSIIKKSKVKAGIHKDISFHTLRHCFATHLIEKGVNVRIIQQLMGHTSLKTTAGYLQLVKVDPHSIVSPVESMNI